MKNNNLFLKKIKKLFFNYRGRIQRKPFILAFLAIALSVPIAYSTLYRLCGLILPTPITNLLAVAYVIVNFYVFFVIYIKRLHDLNHSGWWSLLSLIAVINLLLLIYLAVAKGTPRLNRYGNPQGGPDKDNKSPDKDSNKDNENTSDISDPYKRLMAESRNNNSDELLLQNDEEVFETKTKSSLFSTKTGLILLGILAVLFVFSKIRKKYNVTNDSQGTQNMQKIVNLLPETVKNEVMQKKRSMGSVFVNNQFVTMGVPITKDRVLVRGVQFSNLIRGALSQNKKVEIRFLDNSLANITSLLRANNALSVQMAIFQIDQAIGTPGHLGEKNKKLLQDMNAFN